LPITRDSVDTIGIAFSTDGTLRTWRNADPFGKENICATFEEALVRARIVAGAFKIKTFES
jgi:hypothetical protein